MADKHIIFLMTLIAGMAIFTAALFMAGKGFDLNKINIFTKQNTVTIVNDHKYPNKLKLTSSAFEDGETIPAKYTCEGQDINPPLTLGNIPAGTKSLVLIIDDPDAPYKVWVHWVVYNIDPRQRSINENTKPWNAEIGQSDFGIDEYRGPCPPVGKHRYSFRLYALDTMLTLDKGSTKSKVDVAMKNHIIDVAELSGVFSK